MKDDRLHRQLNIPVGALLVAVTAMVGLSGCSGTSETSETSESAAAPCPVIVVDSNAADLPDGLELTQLGAVTAARVETKDVHLVITANGTLPEVLERAKTLIREGGFSIRGVESDEHDAEVEFDTPDGRGSLDLSKGSCERQTLAVVEMPLPQVWNG
jgi:hypothetical protein